MPIYNILFICDTSSEKNPLYHQPEVSRQPVIDQEEIITHSLVWCLGSGKISPNRLGDFLQWRSMYLNCIANT